MLPNHLYNLMLQLTEESKSLQRIRAEYVADAAGHQDCIDFWQKMVRDKENHIEELTALVKNHLR